MYDDFGAWAAALSSRFVLLIVPAAYTKGCECGQVVACYDSRHEARLSMDNSRDITRETPYGSSISDVSRGLVLRCFLL